MFVLGEELINCRIHAEQNSSINKAIMDFKLLNYMYNNDDYKKKIDGVDKKNMYKFIKNSLKVLVKAYIKSPDSFNQAKMTYDLIDTRIFNDKKSRNYIQRYEFFIKHPKLHSFLFELRYFRVYLK